MNIITLMAKAVGNFETRELRRKKYQRNSARYNTDGEQFLRGIHIFARTFSSVETGEIEPMSGRVARSMNKECFDKFLYALANNVEGRSLEWWELLEAYVEEGAE